MRKCALEMIISTAEDRATAKARRLERERLEREKEEEEKARKWQKEKEKVMPVVDMILTDLEKKFRDYEGNPQDFKMKVSLMDDYGIGHFYTDCFDNIYIYEFSPCDSFYENKRPSAKIHKAYGQLKALKEVLTDMCYQISKEHWHTINLWVYDKDQLYDQEFTLSFDPKCFEK